MRVLAATLGFYVFLIFGSLFFGTAAIFGAVFNPRSDAPLKCARWWSHGLLWCGGVKVETEGASATMADGERLVVLANHQSIYDIPVLFSTLERPAVFLAKRSLFWIPIFGWALAILGFVPVDRGDRTRAKNAYAGAAKVLDRGRTLIVFPEGSRSPNGNVFPFKAGGVRIAKGANAAIVVAGIARTRVVRGKGSWIVRPGTVRIRYGVRRNATLIHDTPRARLVAELRNEIAELSGEQLSQEAS